MDRELRTESAVAGCFVVAAAALALLGPTEREFDVVTALWLFALLVLVLRVEFDVGEGRTRPLALVLLPMLVLLPAIVVPLLVAAAQLAARAIDLARGEGGARRALLVIGDAWFALAPAAVVAFAGEPDPDGSGLVIYAAAVVSQIALDAIVTAVRLDAVGVSLRSERAGLAWVYAVDLLLAPVGLALAVAAERHAAWAATAGPLAVLFAVFARERRGRLEAATRLERVRRESEERLSSILQSSSDLIVLLDPAGPARLVTGATDLLGPEHHDVGRHGLTARAHEDDLERLAIFLRTVPRGGTRSLEWRLRGADGSYIEVESVARNLADDPRVHGIVVATRDITAQRAYEEQLRHRAFTDPITGLPNRALFYDRIEQAIARARRDGGMVCVGFLDMDRFKTLNDRLGHGGGDRVIGEIGRRLRDALRTSDTAARLRGDEFGVLLAGVSGTGEAAAVAERVLAAVTQPYVLDGETIELSASFGVAASAEETAADDLLRQADVAVYAVKAGGGAGWRFYEPGLEQAGRADRAERTWYAGHDEQREEVRSALGRDDVPRMVVQPILDLATREIAGFEALARFDAIDDRPPDQWFAQAGRAGLGTELEVKALRAALALPGRPDGTYVAVNLSPSAIADPRLLEQLPQRLDAVVVEVTEHELAAGEASFRAGLDALRGRGARVAVDDAGAGYAGLKQLMDVGPDLIKLDRSLVDGVSDDRARAALIESLVSFARDIGAAVCAEGVESAEDLQCLAAMQVHYAQGYGIARPAPPWPALDLVPAA